MKFLIDECLSPKLAELAWRHGYGESSHVVWLRLEGTPDWALLPVIVKGDWTFVTRNAVDFRGPATKPGVPGHHAKLDLHAGLVCLNGPDPLLRAAQIALFEEALRDIAREPDLINQVLEVSQGGPDHLLVTRYELPSL